MSVVRIEWGEWPSKSQSRFGSPSVYAILYPFDAHYSERLLEPNPLHGLPLVIEARGPDGNLYRGPSFVLKSWGLMPLPKIDWEWKVREGINREELEGAVTNVIERFADEMDMTYLRTVRVVVTEDHAEVLTAFPEVASHNPVRDPAVIYSYLNYADPSWLVLAATPTALSRPLRWVEENVAHEICEFALVIESPETVIPTGLPPELDALLGSNVVGGEEHLMYAVRERLTNLDVVRMGYGKEEYEVLMDDLEKILRGYGGKPPDSYYLIGLLGPDKSFSLAMAEDPRTDLAWKAYKQGLGELNPQLCQAYEDFRKKLLDSPIGFNKQAVLNVILELSSGRKQMAEKDFEVSQ